MQLRTVLAVLVVLALVVSLLALVGCGNKKAADTGAGPAAGAEGADGSAAPAAGGAKPAAAQPGAGPAGGPPGASPAGGPPGARPAGGPPGARPVGGPPGGGPPGGGPPGAAVGGGNAGALVEEALNLKRIGQLDDAVAKFREALAADPKSEPAHYGLAWTLALQGKKAEAAAEFQTVVQTSTNPTHKNEASQALKRSGG